MKEFFREPVPQEPKLPVNARAYKINKSPIAPEPESISGSSERHLTKAGPSNEAKDLIIASYSVIGRSTLKDKNFTVQENNNIVTVKIPGEDNLHINRLVDQIAGVMNDMGYYEDERRKEVKRVLSMHYEMPDLDLRNRHQKAISIANKEKSEKPKKPSWFGILKD